MVKYNIYKGNKKINRSPLSKSQIAEIISSYNKTCNNINNYHIIKCYVL